MWRIKGPSIWGLTQIRQTGEFVFKVSKWQNEISDNLVKFLYGQCQSNSQEKRSRNRNPAFFFFWGGGVEKLVTFFYKNVICIFYNSL